MSIKTFLTFFLISSTSILTVAQNSKFAIALQTTTIEMPPPLLNFATYERNNSDFGSRFHKDFSLEIIGRLYLKEHIALRLRTGATRYDFEQQEKNDNFSSRVKLTGKLEKYAIGMETNHFFGKKLAFRFGGDVQLGLFKDMKAIRDDNNNNNNSSRHTTFATNNVLSLNPFFGGDWFIWQGLALSAEFRMPFERVRYQEKGTTVFSSNSGSGQFEFDQESIGYVGFGKPVSSIQLSYRF
jgi:hypothetical protein